MIIFKSSPENHFPVEVVHASEGEKPRRRTAEKQQIHLTRPSKCPTIGWCSRAAVRESTNYSSSGTKTGGSRRHELANVYEDSLKEITLKKIQIYFSRLTIDSLDKLLQLIHLFLYTQLSKNVVILYAVEKFADAPKRIGFDNVSLFFRKLI